MSVPAHLGAWSSSEGRVSPGVVHARNVGGPEVDGWGISHPVFECAKSYTSKLPALSGRLAIS